MKSHVDLSADCMYIHDIKLVISVASDGLALNSARPLAGTMLIEDLSMIFLKFQWLSEIAYNGWEPDDQGFFY